jgi:2,3-bisphosphoglycerate-dependent phosphoglycerate mutase
MAKLVILRHGQSYTNSKAHKAAPNETNFLTPKGFQDTLTAGQEFSALYGHIKFDFACCSTYPRTYLTAAAFLSGANHPPIEVLTYADLRERQYGFTEYVPTATLKEMYGGGVIQGWDDHLDTVPGDPAIGETQQQVYDRVIPFFNSVILPKLAAGQNVLCVNHFYVMRALLSHIEVGSAAKMPELDAKNSVPHIFQYIEENKFAWVK